MPKPTIHPLPTEAVVDDAADHVRVGGPKERIVITQTKIKVEATAGTLNADGEFEEHPFNPPALGWVRDRDTFEQGASDHPAPEVRADPFDHGMADVIKFLDTHTGNSENNHGWQIGHQSQNTPNQ